MSKIRIGVFGPTGKMGASVVDQLKNFKNLELVSLCEEKNHKMIGKKISGITVESNIEIFLKDLEVIIDFTTPSALLVLMNVIKKKKIKPAIVSGTTGYSSVQEKKFLEFSKGLTVLRSFNMSLGVNILKNLAKTASLNLADISDIEITESHHNMKRDVPSGTALTLADSILEGSKTLRKLNYRKKASNSVRSKNEIGFTSIRGGDIVGEHTVFFFMDGERIELTHRATDRKIFSIGALRAAEWIAKKKPGFYSILDMIGC